MRNIYLLTKTYLLSSLGGLRGKRSRTKGAIGISVIILLYVALFALLTYMQVQSAAAYAQYGLTAMVLSTGYVMGIFIAICFSLQTITGGQRANDTELLLAMPIKKSEIMVAKALSRYLLNLVIVVLLTVPNIIAYVCYAPFSGVALIGNIVMVLMMPLFTVGLTYIIDFITATCMPNFKYGNVVKAFFTIVLLVGLVILYEYLIIYVDPAKMIQVVDYVLTFNPLFMSILIAGSVAIFAAGVGLFTILMNRETRTSAAKAVKFTSKRTTPFVSLLKNETNRYLNSTVLMINTLLGPITIVAFTVWLMIDRCQTLMPLCTALGLSKDILCLIIMAVFMLMTVMTYPTAFSISLEGKQFWILKSMPLKANTILTAKGLFGVLFVSPIMLLCSTLLEIVMQFNFWYFLMLLLLPVLMNIIIAFGGVLVNLLFPKFDAESDTAVVKNSMSSFIMMLGGFVLGGLLIYLYYSLLTSTLSMVWVLLIPLLLVTVIAAAVVTLTLTVGKRIFQRL